MAKSNKIKITQPTKKHLDRLHRERMQTRWIMIGSAFVLVVVIAVIVYGILDQKVLKGMRAVATVNGEKITVDEFRAYTKYHRYEYIQNAARMYELLQLFGGDTSSMGSLTNQFVSISNELEPFRAGNQSLDQMIGDVLIKQEANRRGIVIDEEAIEQGMQKGLGYYANGTPTPTSTSEVLPTSTLSSLQLTMMPRTSTPTVTLTPTSTITATVFATPIPGQPSATIIMTPTVASTPSITEVITPTATPLPTSTPTPYTFQGYQQLYSTVVADLSGNYEIPEEILRYVIENQLYQEEIFPLIIGEVQCKQEQVWAEHILVSEEALAKEIRQRLDEGEDWDLMARTYSTDTANNQNGGDLGWFPRGQMAKEFEDLAFSLKVGETSQPVKTDFGWHIIRVLGHEDRSLTAEECDQMKNDKFSEWLKQQREGATIVTDDIWQEVVPLQPTLPPEIQAIVDQLKPQIPVEFSTPSP